MSYLAMVKQAEAQRVQYREVLRRWWHLEGCPGGSAEVDEVYQTLIRLLDELGVHQAGVIRDQEAVE